MKKIVVAIVLLAGVTVVAFASLNNNKKKVGIEKKSGDGKEKKQCSHRCIFG